MLGRIHPKGELQRDSPALPTWPMFSALTLSDSSLQITLFSDLLHISARPRANKKKFSDTGNELFKLQASRGTTFDCAVLDKNLPCGSVKRITDFNHTEGHTVRWLEILDTYNFHVVLVESREMQTGYPHHHGLTNVTIT